VEKIVTVDGKKYQVRPMPAHLSPFNARLVFLLKQQPNTFDEAEANSAEQLKLFKRILKETVTPEPEEAHYGVLYNAMCSETKCLMDAAGLFRGPRRSDAAERGASRADASPETKHPVRPG
jgi:hypothetical protein